MVDLQQSWIYIFCRCVKIYMSQLPPWCLKLGVGGPIGVCSSVPRTHRENWYIQIRRNCQKKSLDLTLVTFWKKNLSAKLLNWTITAIANVGLSGAKGFPIGHHWLVQAENIVQMCGFTVSFNFINSQLLIKVLLAWVVIMLSYCAIDSWNPTLERASLVVLTITIETATTWQTNWTTYLKD